MLSQILSRSIRAPLASTSTAPFAWRRAYTKSSSPKHEYFVVVWDKQGSKRDADTSSSAIQCDLAPPHFTFAGEIISGNDSRSGQDPVNLALQDTDTMTQVQGNAFACVADSPKVVRELMEKSVYYHKGIWDMDTVQISALETVHTGNLKF